MGGGGVLGDPNSLRSDIRSPALPAASHRPLVPAQVVLPEESTAVSVSPGGPSGRGIS
jgi:hypothetical protein